MINKNKWEKIIIKLNQIIIFVWKEKVFVLLKETININYYYYRIEHLNIIIEFYFLKN
jgi:hypothetical protein